MRMRLWPIVVGVVGMAQPAMAAQCQGVTQSEMNACAGQELRIADAALNASYSAILQRLKQNAGARNKLLTAERAWMAFRDAECAFVTSGVDGGSIAPMVGLDCRANLTRRRQKDLAGYLSCAEGDLSCPVPHG
jgi:uncharacterized protein YecT (DUF1311 family)